MHPEIAVANAAVAGSICTTVGTNFAARLAEANSMLQAVAYLVAITSGSVGIWFYLRQAGKRR